jgi:hypothetical protein
MLALVGDALIEKPATGAGLMVRLSVPVPVPLLLVALRVTVKLPETLGVPEIRPVEVLTVSPEGRPVAL